MTCVEVSPWDLLPRAYGLQGLHNGCAQAEFTMVMHSKITILNHLETFIFQGGECVQIIIKSMSAFALPLTSLKIKKTCLVTSPCSGRLGNHAYFFSSFVQGRCILEVPLQRIWTALAPLGLGVCKYFFLSPLSSGLDYHCGI